MDDVLGELTKTKERLLELERETQELRLKNEELDGIIKNLSNDISRQQAQENEHIEEAIRSEMESFAKQLAAPIAQIMTQEHLHNSAPGKISADDVLLLAKQLIRSCQGRGLEIIGAPGTIENFNSTMHEPLGTEDTPPEGTAVSIRLVGIAYKGIVLRRAIISS